MLCGALLLHGMAMSTNLKGESVLHRAITGMLTYEASVIGWWSENGSVTIRRRGSRKAAWIWLVNAPKQRKTSCFQKTARNKKCSAMKLIFTVFVACLNSFFSCFNVCYHTGFANVHAPFLIWTQSVHLCSIIKLINLTLYSLWKRNNLHNSI